MITKKDVAIVLRSVPFEERHQIVTAITLENGIISALAKNSIHSRRFGGSLEIFAASNWLFTHKPGAELCHLSEAQIREPFENLRKDFELLSLASLLNELILKTAPQAPPSPELFKLHSNALVALSEMQPNESTNLALLNSYMGKLLQWSGNQPLLHRCLQCERPITQIMPEEELSCLVSAGGWICSDCRVQDTRHISQVQEGGIQYSGLKVKAVALQDFLLSLTVPIRQTLQTPLPRELRVELFRFLEALFNFHIPGFDRSALKSLRFLNLDSD